MPPVWLRRYLAAGRTSAASQIASSTAMSGTPFTWIGGEERPRRSAGSRPVPAAVAPNSSASGPRLVGDHQRARRQGARTALEALARLRRADAEAALGAAGVEGPQRHSRLDDRDRQRVVEQALADEAAALDALQGDRLDRGRLLVRVEADVAEEDAVRPRDRLVAEVDRLGPEKRSESRARRSFTLSRSSAPSRARSAGSAGASPGNSSRSSGATQPASGTASALISGSPLPLARLRSSVDIERVWTSAADSVGGCESSAMLDLREVEDPARVREGDGRTPADPVEVAHSAVAVVSDRHRPAVLGRRSPHVCRVVADVDREEVHAATVARGDRDSSDVLGRQAVRALA